MAINPQRDIQRKQSEREDRRGATDTEERVLRSQDKSMTNRVRCWLHDDLQKVHEALHYQEVLWQAYDDRDSEVAEELHVNSEKDTSQQVTHEHTTT